MENIKEQLQIPEVKRSYTGQELLEMGFSYGENFSDFCSFYRESDKCFVYAFADFLEFSPDGLYTLYRVVKA